MSVIVCGGAWAYRQVVRKCYGACGIEDAPIARTEGNPWYGPDWYCTVCGDHWCSDGLYRRPFRRGWRQEAIDYAVQIWERGCTCPLERDEDHYPLPCKHQEDDRG